MRILMGKNKLLERWIFLVLILSIGVAIADAGDVHTIEIVDYIDNGRIMSYAVSGDVECFKVDGLKWYEIPVNYVINPTNNESLSEEFIVNAFVQGAEVWDAEVSKDLVGEYSIDYSISKKKDGINSVVFWDGFLDTSVLAATSIGYVIDSDKFRITEFDIYFNSKHDWGDAFSNNSLRDLQSIAAHEFGHAFGMGHPPLVSQCTSQTMSYYGGSGSGRTLEDGDKIGIRILYELPSIGSLNGSAISANEINLTWLDNSDNELGFKIERFNGEWIEIGNTNRNVNTFLDNGLEAGRSYTYRVKSYNYESEAISNEVNVTIPALPNAPSGLTAKTVNGKIELKWSDNSTNEQGFVIERVLAVKDTSSLLARMQKRLKPSGEWQVIGVVGENITSFVDANALVYTDYLYRVKSYNLAGNSSFSNLANAKIPATCSDSDGGFNINSIGTAISNAPKPYYQKVTDSFVTRDGVTYLLEAVCHSDGIIGIVSYKL